MIDLNKNTKNERYKMKHKYNKQPLTFEEKEYLFEKLDVLTSLRNRLEQSIRNKTNFEEIQDTYISRDEKTPMLNLINDEIHKTKLSKILDEVHKTTMNNMIKDLTDNFEHFDDEDYSFLNDYLQEERFVRTKSESV